MSTNFYEDKLRHTLKADFESGHIKEVGESTCFFGQIAKLYPTDGSKIDWARVPNSIERSEERQELQSKQFVEFFDEIVKKFGLNGNIAYAGDSATDFALEGSINAIKRVLPELLDIPQHHYFIDIECSWCMSLTMEGDMGFGYSSMR